MVNAVFYCCGAYYTKALMPMFYTVTKFVHPEYEFMEYHYSTENNEKTIRYKALINRDFEDEGYTGKAFSIYGGVAASNLYVHPIILFSLLLAWPALKAKDKLKSLVISLPLLVIIECLVIPLVLINAIEMDINAIVLKGQAAVTTSVKLRDFWFYFLINGGQQFLTLIAFFISIAPFLLEHNPVIPMNTGANSPCPCKSGKKYKQCCGK